jgi:anti-anti-sigma factor
MLATRDEWANAPEFHVWVDATADPPCVGVSGEIDLLTCAAFRDALDEAADQGSPTIAVDLQRTTFMGSTGIRELVRALQTVKRIEARSPRPIVRRALEAAGFGHGDNGVVFSD